MKPRRSTHVFRSLVTLAAVTAGATLCACQSPLLNSDYGATNYEHYTQSVLARQILQGNFGAPVMQSLTVNKGITEVRVDQGWTGAGAGAGGGPWVSEQQATQVAATNGTPIDDNPAGITEPPSLESVAKIGRGPATLNQPEVVVDLSLQDAIARTMKHSIAIKVESYNPAIKEAQIVSAEAALDPVFFANATWNNNDDPQFTNFPSINNGTTWSHQVGVRQILPSGAQIQASAAAIYRDLPNGVTVRDNLNTSWAMNLNLQVTQPLLRGFGTDVTLASIYLAQKDLRLSLSAFKRTVIDNVSKTEEAYLNLILARTNVNILQRLVVASQQTFLAIWARRRIDATKASINQARGALENRQADLIRAMSDFRAASDRLKVLMNDPEFDINANLLINPTDKPIAEPMAYSTAECIELALQQRTEMTDIRLQLERADIVVRVAKNNMLPKLDLIAGVQTNSLSHNLDSAFSSAYLPDNSLDFNAGIKLEFPIGNRGDTAEYNKRIMERRQVLEQTVSVAQTIVQDVKNQFRLLLEAYDEVPYRNNQRIAESEAFAGILEIENIRPRSPEFMQVKLDSQARMALAEQLQIQSIVNYNLAIMNLERAKGTLLEFNRISLDRPPTMLNNSSNEWIFGKPILPK